MERGEKEAENWEGRGERKGRKGEREEGGEERRVTATSQSQIFVPIVPQAVLWCVEC